MIFLYDLPKTLINSAIIKDIIKENCDYDLIEDVRFEDSEIE